MSFVFLGWAFYELSDGSEFEPKARSLPETQPAPVETIKLASHNTPKSTGTEDAVLVASNAPVIPVPTVRRDLSQLLGAPEPTPVTPASLSALSTPVPDPTATAPLAETKAVPAVLPKDIRQVRGSRVNMRGGPGTGYGVLATLKRGQQVIVLREPGNGWAKLKVIDTGRIGWMSATLLKKVPQDQ
ncbi:SH3 domain-containing protein [Shimia sp.]|uniref:SH3 domain-containing protein n=1 Tax=Shimia sp. TaxID=1954381 RepID=UPI003297440B